MTLVNIVVILVVIGLVMWLINTYIPMAGAIKEFTQYRCVRGRVDLDFADVRADRSDTGTQDSAAEVRDDHPHVKSEVNRHPQGSGRRPQLQLFFQQPSGACCEVMGETAGIRGDLPRPSVPANFFDVQLFKQPARYTLQSDSPEVRDDI